MAEVAAAAAIDPLCGPPLPSSTKLMGANEGWVKVGVRVGVEEG